MEKIILQKYQFAKNIHEIHRHHLRWPILSTIQSNSKQIIFSKQYKLLPNDRAQIILNTLLRCIYPCSVLMAASENDTQRANSRRLNEIYVFMFDAAYNSLVQRMRCVHIG